MHWWRRRSDPVRTAEFLIWCIRILPMEEEGAQQPERLKEGTESVDVDSHDVNPYLRYYVALRFGWTSLCERIPESVATKIRDLRRVWYDLGLHRKFIDRLPEPLLAKARDVRYSWYKYRFPALEQDS